MLIQALVSGAHCLGRDSSRLTDFAAGEECGDALLDDGSKQLPSYFAIWRFDGEMWAWRPRRQWGHSQRERALVFGAFSGLHTTLAMRNWARPLPAVSASTVTSQSYSVNPAINRSLPQLRPLLHKVHCFESTPRAWYTFDLCFYFLFYCSFLFTAVPWMSVSCSRTLVVKKKKKNLILVWDKEIIFSFFFSNFSHF